MLFGRQKKEVSNLREEVHSLQCLVNEITVNTAQATTYAANPYPTYEAQVTELNLKYQGQSKWGAQTTRNLIDVRTAFMVGDGIMVGAAPEAKNADKEIAFIRELLRRNNLDREGVQDWAREGEIEGKFLCRLAHNPEDRQIDARFISYNQHGYTVENAPDDYAKYTKAVYRVGRSGEEKTLEPSEFVYKKFGGRTSQVNETPPKLGVLLWDIESLHRALYDWRLANRYFGTPTPHFKCDSQDAAQKLLDKLKQMRWKIGQFIVSTAEFSLVGIPAAGIDSLEKEIVTHAKIISGGSGVPVHFLGFPDLMSNRSTSENLMEAVFAATSRERNIWIGAYNELFEKALALSNKHLGTAFNVKAVKATVAEMSGTRIAQLVALWLPLREQGEISRKTLLEHIPDVNEEEESKRMADEDAQGAKQAAEAYKTGLGMNRPPAAPVDPATGLPKENAA